jgi:hypothetical protein
MFGSDGGPEAETSKPPVLPTPLRGAGSTPKLKLLELKPLPSRGGSHAELAGCGGGPERERICVKEEGSGAGGALAPGPPKPDPPLPDPPNLNSPVLDSLPGGVLPGVPPLSEPNICVSEG